MTQDDGAAGGAPSQRGAAAVVAAPSKPSDSAMSGSPVPRPVGEGKEDRLGSWLPTWPLITTKNLELRKRHGLMVVVFLLTFGLPFIVLGIRLLFHAFDPKTYGPAGSPGIFVDLSDPIAEFGFIIAAVLGATAGTTDLTEGVFRHLVVTGRSRLALYLARIPAGLAILLPLVAVAFAGLCLVTAYAGTAQPTSLIENGVSLPLNLDQAQLESWLLQHPVRAEQVLGIGSGPVSVSPQGVQKVATPSPSVVRRFVEKNIASIYLTYTGDETSGLNPAINEMAKVGGWIELEVAVGFLVGLGLGSLIGQRTVSTILMIVLQIIITPILATTVIPYFINGQRLIVGVAMDQLRPAVLSASAASHGGGRVVLGARALEIPPMPTWAMIAVIVGWIVGWTVIGAWRMMTRDA